MPYKSSKRPKCLDCGQLTSHPKSVRCRPCADDARKGVSVKRSITPNSYRIDGDVAYLLLTDREGNARNEAMIDADDLPLALAFRWSLNTHGYVSSTKERLGTSTSYLLHRVVMGATHGDQVVIDHDDRNTLDCRKSNLRRGDTVFNAGNRENPASSRFPGVTWDKRTKRWAAQGTLERRPVFLGRYETEEEAARVYVSWRTSVGLPTLVDPDGEFRRTVDEPHIVHPVPATSSQYIGVNYCKQTGRWSVRFATNEGNVWLGRHDTEEQAAAVAAEWLTARGRPTLRTVARLRHDLDLSRMKGPTTDFLDDNSPPIPGAHPDEQNRAA